MLWKKLAFARKLACAVSPRVTLTPQQIDIIHDASNAGIASEIKRREQLQRKLFETEHKLALLKYKQEKVYFFN